MQTSSSAKAGRGARVELGSQSSPLDFCPCNSMLITAVMMLDQRPSYPILQVCVLRPLYVPSSMIPTSPYC